MTISLQEILDQYRAGERGLPTYAELQALAADEQVLRRILASSYGGTLLYADDGELQDNRMPPMIDFRRDSPELIATKMAERVRHYFNSCALNLTGYIHTHGTQPGKTHEAL